MLIFNTTLSFAQNNSEKIWVTFESVADVPTLIEGKLISSNTSVQNLIDSYSIESVEQVLPSSTKEELRKVYEISCNCDAIALRSEILERSEELTKPVAAPESILLNDPNDYNIAFSTDYALDLINAKEAWNFSIGDASTIIGISDANYYLLHEELEGEVASTGGYNSSTNYYHGTAVAITAAGSTNNATGKSSIGYNCKLKLIGMNFNELLQMSQEGIRVVNISWSCGCSPNEYLQNMFNEMYENGTIVVAAAGNGSTCGGPTNPVYPAAYEHVISVSSVGPDDNHEQIVGDPSSTHQHNASVDICAPGYAVPISISPEFYTYASGTSFAAPLVTGTIGLMVSLRPCLTPDEVEEILRLSADDIYTANPSYAGQLGWGRLNAAAAVELTEITGCLPNGNTTTSTGTLIVNGNSGTVSNGDPEPTPTMNFHQENKLGYDSQHTVNTDYMNVLNAHIFPNPTNGSSTLKTDFPEHTELTLYNAQGRVVDSRTISSGEQNTVIDLVESGVYFMSISINGSRVWFERIVSL